MAHCCVQILKPKQSVSLPFRSAHIKPSPVQTDTTDVLLGLPRGKPRNPVNRKQATRRHAPQIASESPTRAASDFHFRSSSWYMRRPKGLHVHRSTWPENLVVIRHRTRLHAPPGFPASPSRVGGLSTHLPCAEKLMLTSPDDVISHGSSHVSPRHVISHVSDTS